MPFHWLRVAGGIALLVIVAGCDNSPYPIGAAAENTLFNSFDERSPRYLDPTASYSNPETPYTYSAYEPPYGYHYLKRPYELIPKTAVEVVKPYFVDKTGKRLPDDAPVEQVAESVHEVRIKRGILYAPHPAFAKDDKGAYRYHRARRATTSATSARRGISSIAARGSWSPKTTSMRSSATRRRASKRRSCRCSVNTSSA